MPPKARTSFPACRLLNAATALGLFFILCLNNPDTGKGLCALLIPLAIVLGIFCFSHLREQITLPVLFLILIVLTGGVSMLWAISGKFAFQAFLALLCALCATILLGLLPQRNKVNGWELSWILAGAATIVSLVSLDYVSTRLISSPVLSFPGQFTTIYQGTAGVEQGVRITSFLDAPNVFSGCAGLGVLLCLMNARNASSRTERMSALVMLYLNSMGFVLAFSLGGIISICFAFFTMILMEEKENRTSLIWLMARALVLVLLFLPFVSATALTPWNGIRFAPLALTLMGCGLLCLSEYLPTFPRFRKIPQLSRKALVWFSTVSLVFFLFLLSHTGPVQLNAGAPLSRAAYLQPGVYTLTAESSGSFHLEITAQTAQDAMMHTRILLFSGSGESVRFSVPEGTAVVWFRFTAESQTLVSSAICSGPESFRIPLDRPFLPDFMENRLQGLRVNQNAVQRLVFFRDGLRLASERPLTGNGLGAFETAQHRVQDFYYTTKYVHNHYIQTLLETGVPGLGLYLGLILTSGILIFRCRRKGSHPFAPGLAALLVFMAVHAGVEVIFSTGFYLPLAFGIFMLIGRCCGKCVFTPKTRNALLSVTLGGLVLTALLLGVNLQSAHIGHNASTLDDLKRAADLDPFEWTDYAVSYVANAPGSSDPAVRAQAEAYVCRLEKEQSNVVHYYLAEYCFETGQTERAFRMLCLQMEQTASSSAWWNTAFALVSRYDDGSAVFHSGIDTLLVQLEHWDKTHMGQIQLEESVNAYLQQTLGN